MLSTENNELRNLRTKVSELVANLHATASRWESYTYSTSGGDEGRNPETWVEGEREVTYEDTETREAARRELEALIRNTDIDLLLKLEQPEVKKLVREIYGADAARKSDEFK